MKHLPKNCHRGEKLAQMCEFLIEHQQYSCKKTEEKYTSGLVHKALAKS